MPNKPNNESNDRPISTLRAGLTGAAIGIAEVVGAFAFVAAMGAPRTGSGYAGAAVGSALGLLFLFGLAGAAVGGLFAGAVFLKSRRGPVFRYGATAAVPLLLGLLGWAWIAYEARRM